MGNNRPIGIFDSGVGGLSVLGEIKELLPGENFVFLADQANVPYGIKTKLQLENISEKITRFLIKDRIKMMVVACNTATCYALDHLRAEFKIPIVGVVPAIKPACQLSKKSKIAIMSTPATARSRYLSKLIHDYAPDASVLKLGCDGLEDSIEKLNYKKINKILPQYMTQVKNFGADVLVLGCTHYPLIKDSISASFAKNVSVIDSGRAIAKRVRYLLKKHNLEATKKYPDTFYTTGNTDKFSKIASILLKYKVAATKAVI